MLRSFLDKLSCNSARWRPWSGRSSLRREATMHPSEYFADNLVAMIWECRWLAIGLALSFTALACSRTPMDEQHGVTTNTIGPGGGAGTVTSRGSTGILGGTTGTTTGTSGGGTTSTTVFLGTYPTDGTFVGGSEMPADAGTCGASSSPAVATSGDVVIGAGATANDVVITNSNTLCTFAGRQEEPGLFTATNVECELSPSSPLLVLGIQSQMYGSFRMDVPAGTASWQTISHWTDRQSGNLLVQCAWFNMRVGARR